MKVELADLVGQHKLLQSELRAAVDEVFESCRFILGPNVVELEKEVAALSGVKHAVAVNSGTDALLLSLAALDIQPGDEISTTPFTFVATAETICQLGAVPVFADIDLDTFNIDPKSVEKAITPRTKALLPVHLFGQISDMTALNAIASKHNLPVIGDGAQAIGAAQNGKRLGQFADATTLSFYPTKNLGACGDGGMVVTDSDEVFENLKLLRFHGSGGGYIYKRIGYCSRLDEIQAAILRVKMKRIVEWNEQRKKNAEIYRKRLTGHPAIVLPTVLPGNDHVYHQFTLRVPGEGRRDALQAFLRDREIGSAVFYPLSLHLQAPYAKFGSKAGDFPNSEIVTSQVLSIPVHPHLTTEQVEYAADAISKFE